jgi:hypothetical protein
MIALLLFAASTALAGELKINSVYMADAPSWLTQSRVNTIVERIQHFTEWDLGMVRVVWFNSPEAYRKELGASAEAAEVVLGFSRPELGRIYMGPRIDTTNFDGVFGHELMHVVVHQHYNGSIPKWLEEGLANHVAKMEDQVDYAFLASRPVTRVKTLEHHPFSAKGPGPRYHYMASTALMEMIAHKCKLKELLKLSVGDKLEEWLDSYCHISDVDTEFKKWIKTKSGTEPPKEKESSE